MNIPRALPTTVAKATVRPQEMALAMVNNTLGPGTQIMSVAAIRNSHNRDGMTKFTREEYGTRALRSGHFCIDSIGYLVLYRFDRSKRSNLIPLDNPVVPISPRMSPKISPQISPQQMESDDALAK